MTKILAIDTSTDACSAALLFEHNIIDRFMVAPQQHTTFILPMINEILIAAGMGMHQLDALAFGVGPGSFTGVRLAASLAQGLAFAASLPVVKVSTLRALAQEVFVELQMSQVFVAQDARMQQIYWGEYRVDDMGIMQKTCSDSLLPLNEVSARVTPDIPKAVVGIGSGFEIYKDSILEFGKIKTIAKQYVQAKYVAQIAAVDFVRGMAVNASEALPAYLRDNVASPAV